MKCTYKMKLGDGEMETISFVEGKKYKTETQVAGVAQKSIFDGEVMYNWSEKDKKGTKIDMACMKELENNLPKKEDNGAPGDIPDSTGEKAFDNAMNVKCENASGIDFSVPSDVAFTDQCEMMKNVLKNVPKDMPKIPAGMPPIQVQQ